MGPASRGGASGSRVLDDGDWSTEFRWARTGNPRRLRARHRTDASTALPGLPFDERCATIPHDAGRVLDLDEKPMPGVYVGRMEVQVLISALHCARELQRRCDGGVELFVVIGDCDS